MDSAPHIAVVDDHRDIRDLVGKYLMQHGYRISLAESAVALRSLLERSALDLVVLDVMMQGEDGLSLCRHLRSTTDLPVILLTAMAEETDRIVGLEVGADDYVSKPFSPRELTARVKSVLRRARGVDAPANQGAKDVLTAGDAPIYRVRLPNNTVAGADEMVVYETVWNRWRRSPRPCPGPAPG